MAGRVANCPNCGGSVEFKAGTSLLTVCPYCSSAVARAGGDITRLEILGQVAPLAEVGSPLQVGTRGKLGGSTFTLLGRAQYDFGAGPWNEWYASFDDGRWGWVAEAQGQVWVTFEKKAEDLPTFDAATPGRHLWIGSDRFTIAERRDASLVSAEGELPFPTAPGSSFRYCDLHGPQRAVGTLDFGNGSEVEHLFVGEAGTYRDVFGAGIEDAFRQVRAELAVGLNCPNCGAGIELRVPDSAQRVTCGRCDSVLDCSEGNQLFLLQSQKRSPRDTFLPLGATGELFDERYTVLGQLERSVQYEGIFYYWEEYLLHAPAVGFRWLVLENGHWNFVEPAAAGGVLELGGTVRYRSVDYKHFSSAMARVESLRGEFYWKVEVGETVSAHTFVKPPYVLSKEASASEINWSQGQYVEPEMVWAAFGKKVRLPRPKGVSPAQPNPHRKKVRSMVRAGAWLSALLLLVGVGSSFTQPGHTVVDATFPIEPESSKTWVSTEPFTLAGRGNMGISATAPVSNSWLYLHGQLVHVRTNEIVPFGVEVSYYHGRSGGESWSEGSRRRTVFLGELLPGEYVMKLRPEWARGSPPSPSVRLVARSRVFLWSHLLMALFLLWILPGIATVQYLGFEKRRWAESDHAG